MDFKNQKYQWFVSTEILLEYEEILASTYSEKTAKIILHQLVISPNVEFAEPAFKWNFIENDPDDNKFADLAISVNADYLVTNNSDFNVFQRIDFPKLNVVKLERFLAILNNQFEKQ